MSGVMDMFRTIMGNGPTGAQNPANPNVNPALNGGQGNLPLNQQQLPANLGADPANPQFGEPQAKEEKSPLDAFKDLWEIDPKAPTQPQSLADFKFAIDQGKITNAVNGMDFTKVIPADLMTKISAGGQEAQVAMLQAMQIMSREVMKNSILVNAGIVEGGIKSSGANVEKYLPGAVRKATISNALREDNPLFNDPATAPMLSMLESQLTAKFPNATTDEIKEHARNYLTNFAKAAAGVVGGDQSPNSPQKKQPVIEDFSTWEA